MKTGKDVAIGILIFTVYTSLVSLAKNFSSLRQQILEKLSFLESVVVNKHSYFQTYFSVFPVSVFNTNFIR